MHQNLCDQNVLPHNCPACQVEHVRAGVGGRVGVAVVATGVDEAVFVEESQATRDTLGRQGLSNENDVCSNL